MCFMKYSVQSLNRLNLSTLFFSDNSLYLNVFCRCCMSESWKSRLMVRLMSALSMSPSFRSFRSFRSSSLMSFRTATLYCCFGFQNSNPLSYYALRVKNTNYPKNFSWYYEIVLIWPLSLKCTKNSAVPCLSHREISADLRYLPFTEKVQLRN